MIGCSLRHVSALSQCEHIKLRIWQKYLLNGYDGIFLGLKNVKAVPVYL